MQRIGIVSKKAVNELILPPPAPNPQPYRSTGKYSAFITSYQFNDRKKKTREASAMLRSEAMNASPSETRAAGRSKAENELRWVWHAREPAQHGGQS